MICRFDLLLEAMIVLGLLLGVLPLKRGDVGIEIDLVFFFLFLITNWNFPFVLTVPDVGIVKDKLLLRKNHVIPTLGDEVGRVLLQINPWAQKHVVENLPFTDDPLIGMLKDDPVSPLGMITPEGRNCLHDYSMEGKFIDEILPQESDDLRVCSNELVDHLFDRILITSITLLEEGIDERHHLLINDVLLDSSLEVVHEPHWKNSIGRQTRTPSPRRVLMFLALE